MSRSGPKCELISNAQTFHYANLKAKNESERSGLEAPFWHQTLWLLMDFWWEKIQRWELPPFGERWKYVNLWLRSFTQFFVFSLFYFLLLTSCRARYDIVEIARSFSIDWCAANWNRPFKSRVVAKNVKRAQTGRFSRPYLLCTLISRDRCVGGSWNLVCDHT